MKRSQPSMSEEVLVERLRQHDEQAFQWLYDQYSAALYGVVLKIVKDDEHAKDLLQDIFVKIWKNLDSYDSQKGRLFTWLLNVARNTAIDSLRSKRATQQSSTVGAIHPEADSVHIIDRQHNTSQPNTDNIGMRDIVDQLRPERKQLIDLVYFEGYTHEEAAEALNLPIGTVKTRVRSALQELKKIFSR